MDLHNIRRKKGKIRNLWELVRIFDQVLAVSRDTTNGKQILPMCIIVSKMFNFPIVFEAATNRYYVDMNDEFYDVELLIQATREANDTDYAKVKGVVCEKADVIELLKNPETKSNYENIILRIENHLELHKKIRYDENGYDIFGYKSDGYDCMGYNRDCQYDYDLIPCQEDEKEPLSHRPIDEIFDIAFGTRFSSYYDHSYEYDDTWCEDEYVELNEEKDPYETDYDINYDDVESDYYEDSAFDKYEGMDEYNEPDLYEKDVFEIEDEKYKKCYDDDW